MDACVYKTEPRFPFLPTITVGIARRSRIEGVTEWEIRRTDCEKLAAALRKLESKVQDPEAQGSLLGMATSMQSPVQN